MSRTGRMVAGLLVVALSASGCYGPFRLTRKLHQWNGQVGDKWANEAVFLVFAWVPVYGLAVLGDAVVFNSIEFWGGKNPIEKSGIPSTSQTKRIARGDAEAVLTHRSGTSGEQWFIEQFQQGRSAGSLRIQPRDGVSVATDADGKTLFTAQTLPDGSILVSDAQGKQVAFYSAEQVERLSASARQ